MNVFREVIEGKTKDNIDLSMSLKRAQSFVEEQKGDIVNQAQTIEMMHTENEKLRTMHREDNDRMSVRIQYLENKVEKVTNESTRVKD